MNETNKNIFPYILLSYSIAWGAWGAGAMYEGLGGIALVIGTFAPAVSAVVVSGLRGGRKGMALPIRGLARWRVGWQWYAFSLLCTAAVVSLAIGIHNLYGGALEWPLGLQDAWMVPVIMAYVFMFSALGEEIGWRGFMLPSLLKHYSPLKSSLVVALVWGAWHLPLFFIAGNFHSYIPIWLFMSQILPFSIIYTWMYLNTGGSVFIATLFHAASNATLGMLPVLPQQSEGSFQPLSISIVLLYVVATIVLAKEGKMFLGNGK